ADLIEVERRRRVVAGGGRVEAIAPRHAGGETANAELAGAEVIAGLVAIAVRLRRAEDHAAARSVVLEQVLDGRDGDVVDELLIEDVGGRGQLVEIDVETR